MVRYHPGQRVRVKTLQPRGHVRTPGYIRGKVGVVTAVHGEFRNPESLAYGGDGLPEQALYLVGFEQKEVWGARHQGSPHDRVYADIYEHWLEAT